MNLLVWTSGVLLACGWLWAVPLFAEVRAMPAFACLAGAAICLAVACRAAGRRACWTAPLLLAPVSAVIAATVPVLFWVGSRYHFVDAPAWPTAMILRLLGFDAISDGGTVFVSYGAGRLPFTTTWEKIGLAPWLWIMVFAGIAFGALRKGRVGAALLRCAAVSSLYLIGRYVALIAVATLHPDPRMYDLEATKPVIRVFQAPLFQMLSWMPLAALLALCVPWQRSEVAWRSMRGIARRRRAWSAAALAVIVGAGLLLGAVYQDPGVRKGGKVLFDEVRSSQWEVASRPFDTHTYGVDSVYNYATFFDLIAEHYEVDLNVAHRYTDELLSGYDILVLKMATSPFSDAEVDAIARFVARGGGLFLIGDHTDLLGTSTHLNRVAGAFDMAFRLDAANQLDTLHLSRWSAPIWGVHPASRAASPLRFMTSCTIEAPLTAENVIVAGNTFSDPVDYSAPSFFGNVIPDVEDTFGPHVLCAARKIEKGRVVLFSDSTIFSNFAVLYEGRAQCALGILDYLNRRNASGYGFNLAACIVAIAALGLAVAALGSCAGESSRGAFAVTVLPVGVVLGALAASAWHSGYLARNFSLPQRTGAAPQLAFVTEGCDYDLPDAILENDGRLPMSFDTFFVWTQRLGCFPSACDLDEALEQDAVVIINPVGLNGNGSVRRLERHVRDGGRLFVTDTILNRASTVNRLLAAFGMRVETSFTPRTNQAAATGTDPRRSAGENALDLGDLGLGTPALTISGGDPRYRTADGRVLVAETKHGRGRVIVLVDSTNFSRAAMGDPCTDVGDDDPRRHLFEVEYDIVRELIFDRTEAVCNERRVIHEP